MGKSNIVLFGFMSSGKSTIGGLLSRMNGMLLVDTDRMVERCTEISIEEVFAVDGEERFRELEREEVRRAAGQAGAIIAVGGGAVLDRRNLRELQRAGVMYLLDVSADEVCRRTEGHGGRPLLGEEKSEVEGLMKERRGAYREAADLVVDTNGRKPEEIAREIADDFRDRAGSGTGVQR